MCEDLWHFPGIRGIKKQEFYTPVFLKEKQ
jgi:hypothetical protein